MIYSIVLKVKFPCGCTWWGSLLTRKVFGQSYWFGLPLMVD